MKKILNILYFIFIIILCYISKNHNIFLLTISFSLYILFKSIFSTTSVKNTLEDYSNKKYYYSRDKIFKYSLLEITIISFILGCISYLLGDLIGIPKLSIINIIMTLSMLSNVLIKLISEYLEVINYKKISSRLVDIYHISTITLTLLEGIFLFKVFKLEDYINIILLYIPSILIFIIITIFLYFMIFKKLKKSARKREEVNINLYKEAKKTLLGEPIITIYNIIKSAYLYISIIILYFTLLNKYNYTYEDLNSLTNTYFYGIIFIYTIYKIISKTYNKEFEELKKRILRKDEFISKYFNSLINRVVSISLSITTVLLVISGPISHLLFTSNDNFIFSLLPLLFIYILYDVIVNISIICNKNKHISIILLAGLLMKVIFEIPLIAMIYRMGYSLVTGSIISIMLGFVITIVIEVFVIRNKLHLLLLDNFNNILNTIYENIILCLVLVLFTLVVKVDTKTFLSSFMVIIFYLFITILFFTTKKIILRKKSQ